MHHSRGARAFAGEGAAMLGGPLGALPPLLTLERLLFRMITAAFVLLTLTLATGIAFSETLFGRPLRFDHKTLFALLSWAHVRPAAGGPAFLRLARPHCVALDAERICPAAVRLRRQPLRARSAARPQLSRIRFLSIAWLGGTMEIAILACLILLNGVLAMSEVAVLTSRRTRLATMAASGDRLSAAALSDNFPPALFLRVIIA